MNKERKGEITRAVLKLAFATDGEIKLVTPETWRRKIGQFAEKVGISLDEALEFGDALVREMLEEMLDQSKIGKKPILGPAFKE